MNLSKRAQALLIALAVDALLGDPPNALHPVVALGKWMAVGEQLAPRAAAARLLWGAGWLTGGAALVGAAASRWPCHANAKGKRRNTKGRTWRSNALGNTGAGGICNANWYQILLQGAAASTLLAYRGLDQAVGAVQTALEQGDLVEARRLLSWHLVSRPTDDLTAEEVAAAAIESLAENLSDSLVAPLLAYLAGGLPGMAIYRLVNTADAMWGYRTERYEHLGKAAARTDDLLNLVPARLTAVLIALAAQSVTGRGAAAWRTARHYGGRTASPNAGRPMAALAGALDTTLTKRDHYTLGDGARTPDAAMIGTARMITRVGWGVLVWMAVGYARGRSRGRSVLRPTIWINPRIRTFAAPFVVGTGDFVVGTPGIRAFVAPFVVGTGNFVIGQTL